MPPAPHTSAQTGSVPHPAPPPNIVFVITDDQGYGDLGCTGNPILKTPNLDAFHDQAVRLTNFHVGPTCAPTRAGLLTGHYAGATGVWHTIGGRSLIREREWLLPEALAAAGYRTAMFGKWHLGDNAPYRPQDRGFQTTVAHAGGGIGQQPDAWGNDYFDDTYLANGVPTAFEGYCTDVWFDQAESFIREHTTSAPHQPFFCYLALNAPHSPYNVPAAYYEKYRDAHANGRPLPDHAARFYGMIDHLDGRFGGLDRTLHELGLSDNTVLIFMTDNGSSVPMTDKKGLPQDGFNAGLRGGKGSPYEGGHRVPSFWRWPAGGIGGSREKARDIDALTANIDFMPTLMELTQTPRRAGYGFDGHSLAQLLRNPDAPAPAARSVVTESQRVLQPMKWRKSCVMTDRWRLIYGQELYDMQADPGQHHDVAAQHPDVVAALRRDYEAWFDRVYHDHQLPVPLVIDHRPGGEPVRLNCHDWRYPPDQDGTVPWHQGLIREGAALTGYWEVDVRRPGRYHVELRRWPRETDHALSAGIGHGPDNDIAWNRAESDPRHQAWYTGGAALNLRRATLRIGHQQLAAALDPSARGHTFTLDLPRGPAHLRAEFKDEHGVVRGAYYVYLTPARDIRPLPPHKSPPAYTR